VTDPNRIIEDQIGAASRILFRQAYTHAVPIIFGYSENPKGDEPPVLAGASGALMDFGGNICVVTCDHVVNCFEKKKTQDDRYRFQVGKQGIDVSSRIRDRDEALDLAILDVSGLDLRLIGNRSDHEGQPLQPGRWPNDPVLRDESVVVCGFPRDTRATDKERRTIVSAAFPFVERVTEVDRDSFRLEFDRTTWVDTQDDSPSPEHVANIDLGGLSGSPVFGVRCPSGVVLLELVGILMSDVPFIEGDTVWVRSSRCITADGMIAR
jgi:hypothetical protein